MERTRPTSAGETQHKAHGERRPDDGVSAQLLPFWLKRLCFVQVNIVAVQSSTCFTVYFFDLLFHVSALSCFVFSLSSQSLFLHVDDSHNKPVPVSPVPAYSSNLGSLDGSPLTTTRLRMCLVWYLCSATKHQLLLGFHGGVTPSLGHCKSFMAAIITATTAHQPGIKVRTSEA